MTYREAYFSLLKKNNPYLNRTVVKEMLCAISGFDEFLVLLSHFDESIKDVDEFNEMIKRVEKGEPYQYVLGKAYFVNSFYKVTPDVLIPRQETEQLAVGAYSYIGKIFKDKNIAICDLCTGSGIIGIYLKEKFNHANVVATDISEKALEIARENAQNHGVLVNYLQGDCLEPIIEKGLKFDVLVSNPPYIGSPDTVNSQVLKYEPHLALFANPSTLFYEKIINAVDTIMNPNFLLAFEIGEDQEKTLSQLIEEKLPGVLYRFEKDLYNKTRFLYIIKKEDVSNV